MKLAEQETGRMHVELKFVSRSEEPISVSLVDATVSHLASIEYSSRATKLP